MASLNQTSNLSITQFPSTFDLESFLREEYLLMAHTLPQGMYLTPCVVDNITKRWDGVIFVHSGPYESFNFKFKICFPQKRIHPTVIFPPKQVYHPLVDLNSGELCLSQILSGIDVWQEAKMMILIKKIWDLFYDDSLAYTFHQSFTPNPEALKLKKENLSRYFLKIKEHASKYGQN